MSGISEAGQLVLELKSRGPQPAANWQTYSELAGTAAYDAWYLYHYANEVFSWRQLAETRCSFAELPRKEKSLLVYLLLAACPRFRRVLEIGSSLFEIIEGLELARRVLADGPVPAVTPRDIEFLGIENSPFLAYASQSFHPEHRTRIYSSAANLDTQVDVIVDRSSAGLVFSTTEEFAACLKWARAGILNLFVSREHAFESSVQDRRFVYFSLAELLDRLGGRLYHLFGEKSPGYDRSQGKPVVEGFFLYGDAEIAESFSAILAADPRVLAYAQEKRIALRPAGELLG